MTTSNMKNIGIIIAGSLLLWACSSAPKKEAPPKPTPPPAKPAKTYGEVSIGSSNFMTVPSTWNFRSNVMPKGYVSFTAKNRNIHLVITGYESKRSDFNHKKSQKDLASVTILYRTGSKLKKKTYKRLDDNHKVGGYTHHTCQTGAKCYQVFPLSNWRSVMAADFHVGDMKYTLTAGVDDLDGPYAADVLNALKSIQVKTSVEK